MWTRPLGAGGLCPEELALGSPQGTREELILLAAVVTAAFESFGAGAGDGGRERLLVGRQKDANLPKTHPYTQGTSHTPSELRVGDAPGLSGMNLGLG